MNHGHENDQSARSRVRWPITCTLTICLINNIYHCGLASQKQRKRFGARRRKGGKK